MIGLTVIANGRMAHSARLLARSLLRAAALGRFRSFVTVCDFSALATCYAELRDRDRPKADVVPRIARIHDVATAALAPWLCAVLFPIQRSSMTEPGEKPRASIRPPVGLERMLRMYIAQQYFGLSDEGIEDAIYDSQAIRGFVGIDLTHESAPDATTLLKFRRLLEKHNLTRRIFDEINGHLASKGLMMREGTIVDATLIAAPPSAKNRDEKRDPEMRQSKKGNNWFFGMKAQSASMPNRAWRIRW